MNVFGFLLLCTVGIGTCAAVAWQMNVLDKENDNGHREEATGSSDRASDAASDDTNPRACNLSISADPNRFTVPITFGASQQIGFVGAGGPGKRSGDVVIASNHETKPEPELIPTTIYAYKGLQFTYPFLHSNHGNKTIWRPRQPLIAACKKGEGYVTISAYGHVDNPRCLHVPSTTCTCGIHAVFDPYDAIGYCNPSSPIVAVSLTGRAVIGSDGVAPRDKGIRAEKATIVALCTMMTPPQEVDFLINIDEAGERYDVPVYRTIDEMVAYVEGLKSIETSTEV